VSQFMCYPWIASCDSNEHSGHNAGLLTLRLVEATLTLGLVGTLNLIDPVQAPGATINPWVVPVAALALGVLAGSSIWAAVRNRSRPVLTGIEALIGLSVWRSPISRRRGWSGWMARSGAPSPTSSRSMQETRCRLWRSKA
jgi:hypothetical protein